MVQSRGGVLLTLLSLIVMVTISSPILNEYDIAIVLNQPSMDKFIPTVKKGGILIYDTNGVHNARA